MSPEELRRQERIPRPIMVRYLHPDTSPPRWSLVPARDFSRTGVRFYSEYPFAMGDPVAFHLLLPMTREPVRLMGRVAWKRPETTLGAMEIGVAFEAPTDEVQQLLDEAARFFLAHRQARE